MFLKCGLFPPVKLHLSDSTAFPDSATNRGPSVQTSKHWERVSFKAQIATSSKPGKTRAYCTQIIFNSFQ